MKNNWKNRIMGSVMIVMLWSLLASCQQPQGVSQLAPAEFESSLNKATKDHYVLVDVRTPEEFSEGHLEGALNINYRDAAFAENIQKLDKKQTVYVYCRSGGRSADAVSDMQSMGFTSIVELKGGIIAWEDSQHKIVR